MSTTRTARRHVTIRRSTSLACASLVAASLVSIAPATAAEISTAGQSSRESGQLNQQVDPQAPVPKSRGDKGKKSDKPKGKKNGPWAGYRIKRNGTAAGGWIGGRKLDGRIVYRLDPGAKSKNGRYTAAAPTGDAGKKASPAETIQAAYVLSVYGDFAYDVQAAAVDVAVTDLLAGKKWAMKAGRSRHRVAQTEKPGKVRSFARAMLKDAAASAGAPALGLSVTDSPVGGDVRATVTLRNAAGQPIADKNVRVDYPGQSAQVVRTDQGGTAVATFTAAQAGRQNVTATVDNLPSWDLLVQNPITKTGGAREVSRASEASERGKGGKHGTGKGGKKHQKKVTASRVALAGVKTSRSAAATATVGVQPTISVSAPARSLLASPVPGQFVVSGGEAGERTAAVFAHGPFGTAAAAGCTGGVATGAAMTVSGNGTYSIPSMALSAAGFYSLRVELDGDAVNAPATGCGGVIALQTQPSVVIEKGNDPISVGDFIRAKVTVAGLPSNQGYANNAQVATFGPYQNKDAITCGAGKAFKRSSAYVDGNGASWMDPIQVGQDGFFALVVTLPDGTFSTAAGSACGANGTIVKVQ